MKLLKFDFYYWHDTKREYVFAHTEILNPINIIGIKDWEDGTCVIKTIDGLAWNLRIKQDINTVKSMIEDAMDDIRIEDIDKFRWRDYVITTKEKK